LPKTTSSFLALSAGAGLLLVGAYPQTSSARDRYGTRGRPLEARSYQTMRTLSRHLEETAGGALGRATREAQGGKSSEARFLPSIRSFRERAEEFHRRMDADQASLFEIPSLVDELTMLARQVDARIRSAHALGSIYDDWGAVLHVLRRMTQLLDGRDADAPGYDDRERASRPRAG
jgi:hypothetical protein